MALNDSIAALTTEFAAFKADLSAKLTQVAADMDALRNGTSATPEQIAQIDAITAGLKDADAAVQAFDVAPTPAPAPVPAPAAPEAQ